MKRLWMRTALFLALCSGLLLAAGVELRVSSTRVAPGQSLRVKLVAEGNEVHFPTLDKIGPYPVENLRRSSKLETRYVNGKFSSSSQKILSFEIYPEKSVTIPAMQVTVDGKRYETKPLKIEVAKGAAAGAAGGFTIRMNADRNEVTVGQPLIVTVDAAEPVNGAIVQMQYTPPVFKGFAVKPLGGENQIHRGNVTIHELRYLLIPERPGTLRIAPAAIRVGTRDLNAPADPFGIFGAPVKWTALRSNALSIRVKPLPPGVDLVGHYSLRARVDKTSVKVNQPVNYTLEIVGEGSLEDLPDPRFDIPGVTVYSDDARVKTSYKDGKVYSRYLKKYVFISDRNFEIPSLKLTEYDYQTGKKSTLKTPSFSIEVRGGNAAAPRTPPKGMNAQPPAGRTPAATPRTPAAVPAAQATARENLLEDPAYYARKAYEAKAAKLPWYLAGAFAGGMLLMFLLMRFRPRRGSKGTFVGRKGRHYSLEEALKILYPHINDDSDVERVVRYLYRVKNGEKKVEIDRDELDRLAAKYDPAEGSGKKSR